MFPACVDTITSHPLGAVQVGVQLTLVNISQLFHPLGTPVGIAHPSTNVLLFAHQVTRFHCVGVAGNVKASCFQLIVVAYQSYVDTFPLVIQEFKASN